jgi:hypothetical protein
MYMHTYVQVWDVKRSFHTYMYKYIRTYMHTNIHTYVHVWDVKRTVHTCMHTYIHTYIHTHIHTNIHTYTHTYIHAGLGCEALRLFESACRA